jgi:hypothetical protein
VDLPLPDGPHNATISPQLMSALTSFNAVFCANPLP